VSIFEKLGIRLEVLARDRVSVLQAAASCDSNAAGAARGERLLCGNPIS